MSFHDMDQISAATLKVFPVNQDPECVLIAQGNPLAPGGYPAVFLKLADNPAGSLGCGCCHLRQFVARQRGLD